MVSCAYLERVGGFAPLCPFQVLVTSRTQAFPLIGARVEQRSGSRDTICSGFWQLALDCF